jgi:ABC-type glycerol-3-phosphate transport system permease component
MVFALFPYYWMVITALKPKTALFESPPSLFPTEIVLDNLIRPWRLFPVARYFSNSLLVTGVTVFFGVLIATMAAYGLSRPRFKMGQYVIMFLLLTQLLPGTVTIVPFYFWMRQLHLLNTYIGLILPYLAWTLPFMILMLRAYFLDSYPPELEEAATVDGCSRIQVFLKIILPLSMPGMIAAGAFAFMLAWREFLWASIMLSSGVKKTISVGLRDLIGQSGTVEFISEFMAVAIAATVPAFLLFFFTQRYIAGGITAGAVKS